MNRDKELIEAYWKWKEFKKPDFVFSDNLIAAFLASDEYKALGDGWISVEDRLPTVSDVNDDYLVLVINGDSVTTIEYNLLYLRTVFTHWQPLPSPPKTEPK
jgi:hypothetical protein